MNIKVTCKKIHTKHYRIWFNELFEKTVYELIDTLHKGETYGNLIKTSKKATCMRVDNVFIKLTNFPLIEGIFRHTFLRGRYKAPWEISILATELGIPVPTPIFYLENLYLGLPWQSIFASEFIHNSVDVETFAKKIVQSNLQKQLENMLFEIVKIVTLLWSHNLYHKDLSGKNILTTDGINLFLVDLDSVKIISSITLKHKVKNLTQLYDSFCDFVEEEILKSCIFSLLSEFSNSERERIYREIKRLQITRRNKHLQNLRRNIHERK